jgi:hypothetical protein
VHSDEFDASTIRVSAARTGGRRSVPGARRHSRRGARLLVAAMVVLDGCNLVETDGAATSNEETACAAGLGHGSASPEIVAAFRPCCDGSAHYLPQAFVPRDVRAMLAVGPDDTLCVPDVLSTNANMTPVQCTSLFQQPGACLSSCIEGVSQAPVALPKDICGDDELCAPCIDPRTNTPSGACSLGALACIDFNPGDACRDYMPGLDLTGYAACGVGAHCAPDTLVSDKQRELLDKCADGTSTCVPDDFLLRGGHYTPPTCKSVGGREGRCLSVAIPRVSEQQDMLPVDTCDATDERCAPCYDPRNGEDTRACEQGFCDPGPSEPARPFEQCGYSGGDALCVPANLVPADKRDRFDAVGCKKSGPCAEADTLCVPTVMVDAGASFSPKKCKNNLTGFLALFISFFSGDVGAAISALDEYSDGRCLSRCLPDIRPKASLLGKSGCEDNEVCAPCYDPQKPGQKVPTGACDF